MISSASTHPTQLTMNRRNFLYTGALATAGASSTNLLHLTQQGKQDAVKPFKREWRMRYAPRLDWGPGSLIERVERVEGKNLIFYHKFTDNDRFSDERELKENYTEKRKRPVSTTRSTGMSRRSVQYSRAGTTKVAPWAQHE